MSSTPNNRREFFRQELTKLLMNLPGVPLFNIGTGSTEYPAIWLDVTRVSRTPELEEGGQLSGYYNGAADFIVTGQVQVQSDTIGVGTLDAELDRVIEAVDLVLQGYAANQFITTHYQLYTSHIETKDELVSPNDQDGQGNFAILGQILFQQQYI